MSTWCWSILFMVIIWQMPVYAQSPDNDSGGVRWNGDLRMRWQGDFESGKRARNVFQYRFRLNMSVPVNEQVAFGTRLMTGDPRAIVSGGDVNVSDFLDRKDIVVAWAYGRYRPVPGVTFLGGKFPTPFFKATQLVYDNDLAMEGAGQQFRFSGEDNGNAFGLNLAEIFIYQPVSSTRDVSRTYLLGAQAFTEIKRPGISGTFGVGVYGVGNANPIYLVLNHRPSPLLRSPNTNRPNAAGAGYLSKFRVVNVGGRITRSIGARPLTFSFDYAINPGASNERQAVVGVLTYGNAGSVGGTRVGIHGFHIESDAVLSAFSNIDYMQTNSNGVGLFVNHQPLRNVVIDIVAYTRKYDNPLNLIRPSTTNRFRSRMRLQLSLRF